MSLRFLFFATLLLTWPARAQTAAIKPQWKLTPVAALQKLTARAPGQLEPFRAAPIQLRGARGQTTDFQFVVAAGDAPIQNIKITRNGLASIISDFIAPQNLQIYRENYVFVAKPSGNRELKPKWWPDALVPLEIAPKDLAARQSAVFWASLQIPLDAAPGDYYGELDLECDGAPRRLALTLNVTTQTLPAPQVRGTVALYYDVLRDWYRKNGQKFSDLEWRAQKKRYYDFLLDFGLNAYDLPVDWNDAEVENYLRNPRVLSARTPEIGAPDFQTALQKLRATGTLSKAFYYRIDEPTTPAQFDQIRQLTPQLRALGIAHLVTAHPNESLKDAVDIWCPNLGDFFGIQHLSASDLAAQRQKGRQTWFYTMVEPKFPAPTWLLDDDAASVLAFGPLMARYGFSGFVYSMAHGWGPKPLENLQSFANTNGDGTLIYPAEIVGGVGPMPSIRLMLLRQMMQKWELGEFKLPVALAPRGKANPTFEITREGAPSTVVKWRFDAKKQFLIVHFRAAKPQNGDYVGVELAPLDIELAPEKWRFIATRKGNLRAEKWTREARFALENSGLIANIREIGDATATEMRIPLSILGNPKQLRFDALRGTTVNGAKITIYAHSGTGDPELMPIIAP